MGPRARALAFCGRLGMTRPIFMAPMAGASPPALAVAVAEAGGMGALGALTMTPAQILDWAGRVRAAGCEAFQINLWVRDPPPRRDPDAEERMRGFLGRFGPLPGPETLETPLPNFDAQLEAILAARPPVVSSIMGLFAPEAVRAIKARGCLWFATVSTVRDALAAEAAGADVLIVQGVEAGGHRAAFDPARAADEAVGLMALTPAVADAVRTPVIAAGGVADGRGVAAALALGASAVMIGTALLSCPEAGVPDAWREALRTTRPEQTRLTRAFTGRPARSVVNAYVEAAASPQAPEPLPYPLQRAALQPMQADARRSGDAARLQMWAGQACALASTRPAAALVTSLWEEAQGLLA